MLKIMRLITNFKSQKKIMLDTIPSETLSYSRE